jgi:hypothetical protein
LASSKSVFDLQIVHFPGFNRHSNLLRSHRSRSAAYMHFGLRTLLIATTLVAVVLGLIVWLR